MREYGESNETDDENQNPITISIPVSDKQRTKQTPVKIPVRPTSETSRKSSLRKRIIKSFI